MRNFVASLALMALPLTMPANAQPEVVTPSYRIFSAVSAPELEQALNHAGAEGYRVASLSESSGGDVSVVMERAAGQVYQYRVPFGGHRHVRIGHNDQPLLDIINEAGHDGYRFVPGSVVFGHGVSSAMVLEHESGSTTKYEYLIFAPLAISEDRFERSAVQAEKTGFRVVFHGVAGTGIFTLMEKQDAAVVADDTSDSNRFVRCPAKDIARKYQEQVAEGYIPLKGSLWVDPIAPGGIIYFWLHKSSAARLRVVSGAADSKQDTNDRLARLDAFVRELNTAAGEGYRLAAPPLLSAHFEGQIHRKFIATFNAVMQPVSEGPHVNYRLVTGDSLPELAGHINEAAQEGFHVIPGTLLGNDSVFMEKTGAVGPGTAER